MRDKGRMAIIVDIGLYANQVLSILTNSDAYQKLESNSTPIFRDALVKLLNEGFILRFLTNRLNI